MAVRRVSTVPAAALVAFGTLLGLSGCTGVTPTSDSAPLPAPATVTEAVIVPESDPAPATTGDAVTVVPARSAAVDTVAPVSTPASDVPAQVAPSSDRPAAADAPAAEVPDADARFECGSTLTGPQALAPVLGEIPTPNGWDLAASDFSAFDPCEAVSWATLVEEGAPGAVGRQVVLFSYGEPIQAAFGHPTGFESRFQRQGEDGVLVTSYFTEDGQIVDPGAPAVRLTYRFDAQRHAFLQAGTIDADPAPQDLTARAFSTGKQPVAPLPTAAPGAGGLVPTVSRGIGADTLAGTVRVSAADTVCEIDYLSASCGVEGREGGVQLEPVRSTEGAGLLTTWRASSEAPVADVRLVEGEVRHVGPYVFAGQAEGLTVWNSRTGHGFVLGEDVAQF